MVVGRRRIRENANSKAVLKWSYRPGSLGDSPVTIHVLFAKSSSHEKQVHRCITKYILNIYNEVNLSISQQLVLIM